MGKDSKIEWTDHTFNPWWGCTKVSPGCDNCYAEALDRRWFKIGHWGKGQPRRIFDVDTKHWAEPFKWNAKARDAGKRARVFCASMADVFDNEVYQGWRDRLFEIVEDTEHLDWLMLTKRIGNVAKMVPTWWQDEFPPNVWIGASIVNQEEAERDMPKLLEVPASIHFISYEPALGPVYLTPWLEAGVPTRPDWVIVGGESGPGARPFNTDWAQSVVDQCRVAAVACFVKQLGAHVIQGGQRRMKRDRKGGDMSEWPHEIRVREFPPLTNSQRV